MLELRQDRVLVKVVRLGHVNTIRNRGYIADLQLENLLSGRELWPSGSWVEVHSEIEIEVDQLI